MSLMSSSSVGESCTIMVHIPTMSTGVLFVPVMLMPNTRVIIRPGLSAYFRVTRVMEAPVSTIMAPSVVIAPGFI